jgi:parallel beta-helix repeat protein
MLFLLLLCTLTLTFSIRPVKAWCGIIYIRSWGSVEPSTAPILQNGSLYTMTDSITSDADGIVIERNNIILDGAGHTVQGSGDGTGISLSTRSNVTIKNVQIKGFYRGVYLDWPSRYNIMIGNNITDNYYGLEIWYSSNNIIKDNIITNNGAGLLLGYSKYNIISGNTITMNSWVGIEGFGSSYNSIVGNTIAGNYGHAAWFSESSDNMICGNNIADNYYGIYLDDSSNNVIYHNNFVNDVPQIYAYNSVNVWDDGYPSGGNYWSDYIGSDLNNDGIGDTPYVTDADNMDRYPHMNEWESTIYLEPSTVTAETGTTFNVSIMASRVQNLWAWQAGIQWNPTVLEYVSHMWGEFQILAGASEQSHPSIDSIAGKTSRPALESALREGIAPVSADDVRLLTITFKVIKAGTSSLRLIDVALRGQDLTGTTAYPRWSDVNSDGVVDTEDIMFTYSCWEDSYYSQTADVNDNGLVEITDMAIVTSDFGKHNTNPEWGVTNIIYDIPAAIVDGQVQGLPSKAYISVPYHSQQTDYYCGPAALEMVFDFYGPDIDQLEIADVALTMPDGTTDPGMIRAAHFSNLSTSMGTESSLNYTGYTNRKLGYAAFYRYYLTTDELKSLIASGYPIIVATPTHFRVAVGYNITHIMFQDSAFVPTFESLFTMKWSSWESEWDHNYGLFVAPWDVKVSNVRNVVPREVFNVEAKITYPCPVPFLKDQYPATLVNVTVTLPAGLTLVPGETGMKTIGDLAAGGSCNVNWTVQAETLGNYFISVKAEGEVTGHDEFDCFYEDRIGGFNQSVVAVTSSLDLSPPITIEDYDGLWHSKLFRINLTAEDDNSGILETYYRINNGPPKTLSIDGQPYITTCSANNILEYWSVDWAGNEEAHKFLYEIKLDNMGPTTKEPSHTPSDNIQPDQEVKVTVEATDAVTGVKNVTLFYTITDEVTWENRIMSYNTTTGLYETTIPAQSPGTCVKYKIVAYDNIGNKVVKNNFGRYYSYRVQYMRISATIDIIPNTLNLGNKAEYVTAYIELPEGYNVNDINVSSISLNKTIPVDLSALTAIGDYDNDTIPDLMVKFDRTAVCNFILSEGFMTCNVTLTVSGKLYDGTMFEGSDVIRVRMLGDINMDGKVDIQDLVLFIKAFGSYVTHPRWNIEADLNNDHKVDIQDLVLLIKNFGKTYP